MKRVFLLAAMLALFASATSAYAWDTQATGEEMNYQSSHGQSLPTIDYPIESSGRY
jgi:hypothetical protein